MNTVLVVDDERNIRETLKDVLEDEEYEVLLAEDGRVALEILEKKPVDVVLLDLRLPEIGGMDVLSRLKKDYYNIQVIMISGHGTIEAAVKAIKKGAFDFIEKPLSLERILRIVDHAVKIGRLRIENIKLRENNQKNYFMVRGASKSFHEIESIIDSCADSNSRIFITGENGTGKEVIARKVHEKSNRRNESFIAVNCAAIPQTLIEAELFGYEKGAFTGAVKNKRGKFDLADRGTIFLDEIADMSLEAQSKVLRVLEEMQFERVGGVSPITIDVRVIAATNRDVLGQIQNGGFREDLYYRLNVVPIHLPPLRERREDIPPLINYYFDYFANENNKKRKSFSDEAFKYLIDVYPWPGNIRELKNLIERLNILTKEDIITLQDIKAHIPHHEDSNTINSSMSLRNAKEHFEKNYIVSALRDNRFNIAKTADKLNVERSNLYKLIKKMGIEVEGY
ncbi:MAG: sigma-54-dependent Fis family transcriptional regulator [Spirochaetes bacterium]|nr:sigma-54-dependent Fis family transcriptional regulator [Spirochaetota bacterium]